MLQGGAIVAVGLQASDYAMIRRLAKKPGNNLARVGRFAVASLLDGTARGPPLQAGPRQLQVNIGYGWRDKLDRYLVLNGGSISDALRLGFAGLVRPSIRTWVDELDDAKARLLAWAAASDGRPIEVQTEVASIAERLHRIVKDLQGPVKLG